MWILEWKSRSCEGYISPFPYFTDDPDEYLQTAQPYTNNLDKAKVFRTKDEAERFAAELDDASNLDAVCKSTELAEGDLLGELIEALRSTEASLTEAVKSWRDLDGYPIDPARHPVIRHARALLSRLPEPKGGESC